jgi:hypothetical protein|tara:strand:+ start:318 stop:479 length:162 start_codon:yes stop_codon:yes gene_type:complete
VYKSSQAIDTAAYATWLSVADASGTQFGGGDLSSLLILQSWMRSRYLQDWLEN